MADIKISQLNQAVSYTLNDIVAIVDSGNTETKKININDLLRNTDNVVESTTNTNGIMLATDAYSGGFQVLRGSNTTSAVVASTESYIEGGQNHFVGGGNNVSIQIGAAGHGAIVGSDTVSITGGYNHLIAGSYNGPSITGGEECVILASVGSSRLSGNNNALVGTQGVVVDGTMSVGLACEGSTQQAGNHFLFGGGYNLQGQINNLINQGHFGYKNLNVGDGISGFNVGGSLGTEDCTVDKTRSVMVAASGHSTLYETTLHTGAIHNFGPRSSKVINAGNVSGTVDVDGSLGESFIFTLVGDTQPNFINLREGQKFIFSIYNTTFSVTGGTINGVGGNVLAKGGNISPSNNSWSFYTGFYDGTRVYLIEENGLSSI